MNLSQKIDLTDATFIIPIKIDSEDRTRNIITVLCFLLKKFNTKIILKEVDTQSYIDEYVMPQISEFLDNDELKNLIHLFEYSKDSEFHRMKIINEMLNLVNTEVVINYDCDVLLKPSAYLKSVNLIVNQNYDLIYPYGFGDYQKQVNASDELVSDFLNNRFDFSILEKNSKIYISQYGHVQFFKTSSYIEGGMENENFISWSPEDKERFYRFVTLGYNVGRLDDEFVYHLEHSRGENSSFNNPYFLNNEKLWRHLQDLDKDGLKKYYNEQNYLTNYR